MPKVSIVILNWNGKKFLKSCLDSLRRITYKEKEIIIVDNNSADGSQKFIRECYPEVILVENKKNYGFAKGNNIGFSFATGDFILILNNDTIVSSNFLDILLMDFKQDKKIGCIQPQIRLSDSKNRLDGVGGFLTRTGFLYHFGYLKRADEKKYAVQQNIFSAKGACMLLRKDLIKKIGLFDEDFFIFFEETDLCYRIWLSGYRVVYEPKSVIYHVGGGDTTASNKYQYERRIYLSFRNMLCSYIKNFGIRNMLTILPTFIVILSGLAFHYVFTLHFRLGIIVIKAYFWNIINIRSTLKKRFIVQRKIRKISDKQLNALVVKNPKFSYYKALFSAKLSSYHD